MYEKDIDLTNRNEMISFLANHFRYNTMSSWNRMTSYANCVKMHNLNIPLELDDKAWNFLTCDDKTDYEFDIDDLIDDFTAETGYTAGFNGRSSGYIVMYDTQIDKNGHRQTLMHGIDEYEDFEEWETEDLVERVKLVKRFDRLCDEIRDTFLYHVENAIIENVEVIRKETKRVAGLPA